MATALQDGFLEAASRYPERTAVIEPGAAGITYQELGMLAARVRDRLRALGVSRGDRVGIYLRKSIDAVATICGILEAGVAYVPVDPGAPAERCAYILHNCGVKALFIEERFVEKLRAEFAALGTPPALTVLDGTGAGAPP